jgi:hypothetical protein
MPNHAKIFTAIVRGTESDLIRAVKMRHLQLLKICHESHGECVAVIKGPSAVVYDWECETPGKYPGEIVWVTEGSPQSDINN